MSKRGASAPAPELGSAPPHKRPRHVAPTFVDTRPSWRTPRTAKPASASAVSSSSCSSSSSGGGGSGGTASATTVVYRGPFRLASVHERRLGRDVAVQFGGRIGSGAGVLAELILSYAGSIVPPDLCGEADRSTARLFHLDTHAVLRAGTEVVGQPRWHATWDPFVLKAQLRRLNARLAVLRSRITNTQPPGRFHPTPEWSIMYDASVIADTYVCDKGAAGTDIARYVDYAKHADMRLSHALIHDVCFDPLIVVNIQSVSVKHGLVMRFRDVRCGPWVLAIGIEASRVAELVRARSSSSYACVPAAARVLESGACWRCAHVTIDAIYRPECDDTLEVVVQGVERSCIDGRAVDVVTFHVPIVWL